MTCRFHEAWFWVKDGSGSTHKNVHRDRFTGWIIGQQTITLRVLQRLVDIKFGCIVISDASSAKSVTSRVRGIGAGAIKAAARRSCQAVGRSRCRLVPRVAAISELWPPGS